MREGFGSAPGKVILTGEHSVVYGYPAIVASVGLRCEVIIRRSNPGLTINANDLDQRLNYTTEQLKFLAKGNPVHPKFDNIATAVLGAAPTPKIGLEVDISSQIPISAGLGSSAAVVVATIASISDFYNLNLTKEDISGLGFSAEVIAHGTPSGIDNSIATYGGILRFENGEIKTKSLDYSIPLLIGNTKVPRDTKKLVSGVKTLKETHPELIDQILRSMGNLVKQVEHSMEKEDLKALGNLLNINQGLLESIGVNHQTLSHFIWEARASGALGAKLTGAGGGGCMIAICKDQEDLNSIADDLNSKGIDIIKSEISPNGVIVGR